MIPDPENVETFERSKLQWDEVDEGRHKEMLDWFHQLLHLRRGSTSLNNGELSHIKVQFDEKKQWLTMDRGQIRVMCNLGPEPVELENPACLPLFLTSHDGIEIRGECVFLPPDSLAILSGEEDEKS